MTNTTPVYARIDSQLKEDAENILNQLGITPSSAIQMLYRQIVLTRSLPLELKLPNKELKDECKMSKEELDAFLMKGFESMMKDKPYSIEEANEYFKKELGI